MSGSSIPYHLRVNKHIDREIFVELIRKVSQFNSIDSYEYISFGAAHLHDFKYIHNIFGLENMHSLEIDPPTFRRQLINKQFSCINCNLKDSSDFINDFPMVEIYGREKKKVINSPIILWLDFTAVKDLGKQIAQFKTMIEKAANNSIIKITLNSHLASLFPMAQLPAVVNENAKVRKTRLANKRREILFKRLGVYANDIVIEDDSLNQGCLTEKLYELLSVTSQKATEGLSRTLFKLNSSFYSDGQGMLTFTGIILDDLEVDAFKEKTNIESWGFYNHNNFDTISVPVLSNAEKGIVDKYLPNKFEKLINKKCVKETSGFVEALESYQKYYRQYPNFLKAQV